MATPITMPQLSETMTEGTIGHWLKNVGDQVRRYDPLVEIITDKVNVEMTSSASGVLKEIVALEGQTIAVGGLLASIESIEAEAEEQAVKAAPAPPGDGSARPGIGPAIPSGLPSHQARQRLTPVVARLAQEYGVDLRKLTGTGIEGRVTKQDLLDYIERSKQSAAPSKTPQVAGEAAPLATDLDEEALPLTPVRRTIAEHMVRSKFTAPHAWSMVEVDVTPLVRRRESIKEDFRLREGVELTYLPFVVKVVAETLKEYPALNAAWAEDKVILKRRIHIGIAVARDEGLIVPVVRNADRMSVAGLAHAISDLVARAKANTLTPEDVSGGTFTVNNTGALGSILSYPILYPGQAGILTMEAIVKRPVVVDPSTGSRHGESPSETGQGEAIAIRSMMNVTLAFDHRILDGSVAGGFLHSVKSRLELLGPDTPIY